MSLKGKFTAAILFAFILFGMVPVAMAQDFLDTDYRGKTVILHTNDVHGAILGYSYLAGLKKELEEKGAEVILVDVGDFSQGTTNVSINKGLNAITLMNAVGYDYVEPGNHEFDYSFSQFCQNIESAEFKVLCSNIFDEYGNLLFDSHTIYTDKNNTKIGFFGVITPETQTQTNPSMIEGLNFFTDINTCAQNEINALKEEGADLIIGLAHLGVKDDAYPYRSIDLYQNTQGIDFIIDGHSHTRMISGENNEPIQSTGTVFSDIGMIVIDKNGSIVCNELIPVNQKIMPDSLIKQQVYSIMNSVKEEYGNPFAESKVALNGEKNPGNRTNETNFGDLIADAMVYSALNNCSDLEVPKENVVSIINGGTVCNPIDIGEITRNDIKTALPFDNSVVVVYVKGFQLLEVLEASTFAVPDSLGGFPQISGMNIMIDKSKQYIPQSYCYPNSTYYGPKTINRVTINSVNGKPFDSNANYAIVTNSFCADGGDTYYVLSESQNRFDTGISCSEAIASYIEEYLNGIIDESYIEPQGRITIISGQFSVNKDSNSDYNINHLIYELLKAGIEIVMD